MYSICKSWMDGTIGLFYILCALIFCFVGGVGDNGSRYQLNIVNIMTDPSPLVYSRIELLNIKTNCMMDNNMEQCLSNIPKWIKRRKRGKKGGIRVRLRRRKCKHPLPTVIFGNVRSVTKQYSELLCCVKYLREYREACALCFNETWLHSGIEDNAVHIEGFKFIRGDRNDASGKQRGGGVCAYINNKWCNNITVKHCACSKDIEIISVLCRPFYLPRELSCVPVTMKCLEKIILSRLLPCITPSMDKLQFAYRQNRSIEDAIITVLNYIYQHLDTSGSYVRALFIDYSSAFNTIIPNILINKLKAYGVEPYLCAWISDFLKDRKQQVCIASQGQFVYSQMLTTNTGAPQGCVLSPVLFTMYTNDCTSHSVLCKLIKYADDSILLGLIKSENELAYRQEIIHLSHWCKNHNLLLNVQKTKEVIFDFRKKCSPVDPVYIENEHVEIVEKYKYLGTYIRNDLKWYDNVEFQCKKAQKRLYFLRKLKEFKVDTKLLELFYKSVVESVAISCIIVWFKALTVNDIKSLKRIKRQAERIIGIKLESFDEIYCNRVIKKVKCILEDESHPLSHLYQVLPSGKRFKSISCKTKRSAQSFLPTSVSLCNAKDTLRDLISMN